MKMTLILSLVVLFASLQTQAQPHKCFNGEDLAGRRDMIDSFMKKKYKDFDKKFHELCKKNSDHLICEVATVKLSEAPKRISEISSRSNCTEVLRVDQGKKKTKIYSLDDKNAPQRTK